MSSITISAGELAAVGLALSLSAAALVGLGRVRKNARRDREDAADALAASEAVSAALSEEALFLSAVLGAVDSVIVLFDRTGRVRFVNDRFDDVFGMRGSDVLGRSRDHFIETLAPQFADPDQVRIASTQWDEERASGSRNTRHSGIVMPDEVELALLRPRARRLLFSTAPVVQGERRIGMISMFRDVTAQRAAEDARERLMAELAARATTDALTGLANRRAGGEGLSAEIERARRYKRPLSVALFDVDHFKRVNDDFGHEIGDRVLRTFGDVLSRTARSTDIVARWGGEEFLAILPEADLVAAKKFADRVRVGLAEADPLRGHIDEASVRPVTCSVGVTTLRDEDAVDVLVRRADDGLYEGKRAGRDRVVAKE